MYQNDSSSLRYAELGITCSISTFAKPAGRDQLGHVHEHGKVWALVVHWVRLAAATSGSNRRICKSHFCRSISSLFSSSASSRAGRAAGQIFFICAATSSATLLDRLIICGSGTPLPICGTTECTDRVPRGADHNCVWMVAARLSSWSKSASIIEPASPLILSAFTTTQSGIDCNAYVKSSDTDNTWVTSISAPSRQIKPGCGE